MLKAEKLQSNWVEFLENIKKYITGERQSILLSFYETNEERFVLMPASSKTSYHNAFPGGYVDHVNRVLKASFVVKKAWEDMGAEINFSDEELAMVAINHDLGKFGSAEFEAYVPNDSDWHVKRGEVYKSNPSLEFMKIQDRSLFLLQDIGINLSSKEYLGVKLHDGLYEEGNKGYYIAFSDDYKLRSNLAFIVHQGDLMAARIEGEIVKRGFVLETPKVEVKQEEKKVKKPVVSKTNATKLVDKFLAASSEVIAKVEKEYDTPVFVPPPSISVPKKNVGSSILNKFLNE